MLSKNSAFGINNKKTMNNPFTGIATFLKSPYVDNIDEVNADIAVIGMPYDLGTAVRAGARFAPRAIRDASTWNCYAYNGWYSPIDDEIYMDESWKVVDCGDIDVVHTTYEQSFKNCTAAVKKIIKSGAVPFIMGGDHSITIPVLHAFDAYKDLCVIHIDAHLDFSFAPAGIYYGQGSPIRRASEMGHIGQIVQIGMRGIGSSTAKDWRDAKERGNILINSKQVREGGLSWVTSQIPVKSNYYITFDIDALDQSIAPGCGSPQPFGLYYEEAVQILKNVASKGKIVGFDMVEVCPPYDFNESTSLYAANLMLDAISYIWKYNR